MALDRETIGGWVTKLQGIADRFVEVEKRVSDPSVASDQEAFTALMIEHRRLKPMAEKANDLAKPCQLGRGDAVGKLGRSRHEGDGLG